MSVLSIKDEQGNWIPIPTIKGDKGDKGDVGESGVYVGTDEPTDFDIKVWVDTTGDSDDTTVEGSAVTIVAQANHRYKCGELLSLNFTPSETGICDVVFTSGSTPTVLTIPDTVKLPSDFDVDNLDANTIYEINIMDGIYGAVMKWT